MVWPSEVYDYEREMITDAAVGGVDLRKGAWIHCKRCNSTLKMSACFSLTSWKNHLRGKTHLSHEEEFLPGSSQPQFVSISSQSSVHSSVSGFQDVPGTVVTSQLSQDHELMFVRRDLHHNKQHQARYQRDVSNVISAMTSLITDQQSDLDALQHTVADMTSKILALQKDVERLRHKEEQKKPVQVPPKKVAATVSYSNQRKRKISVEVQGGRSNRGSYNNSQKKGKEKTLTDMDIFEKRFQLG
ncbi:hypothetical protein KRP22_007639 [Phytophthora ramorum]|uniref:uncharacterized protein n=1 Tax=Phytophthora ramorum TaxID=164328 RepID=UPI0030B18D61|nr:hypothetical protein KRP23_14507 [Phytophthora ramorum]KAH7506386.1 hypothetical protein KRP22_4349 [Phytophthora ramorum]